MVRCVGAFNSKYLHYINIGQLKNEDKSSKIYISRDRPKLCSSTVRKGVNMTVENNNNDCHAEPNKRTYSVQEVADILQISKSMAYSLCKDAPFKCVKVGKYVRISKPSFDAWLDSKI